MVMAVKQEVDPTSLKLRGAGPRENFEGTGVFTIDIIEADQPDINNLESIMGTFKTKRQARESLVNIAKEYNLCDKFLGLQKTKGACFNYQLGRCKGICAGKEIPMKYNLRFIEAFLKTKIKAWPHNGPIVLKEVDAETGKVEEFLIHNWCVVQKKEDTNLEDLVFDIDVYKILRRFMYKENFNRQRIFQLPRQDGEASEFNLTSQ